MHRATRYSPNEHHHHQSTRRRRYEWRLSVVRWTLPTLSIAQIIGGLLAGSLSLIADAMHNLSDAMSLAIAFAARK